MKHLICAICDTNKHVVKLYSPNFDEKLLTGKIFSARRTPDKIHYQFLICKQCGLIFSSPILSAKKIAKLYNMSTFTYSCEAAYLANTYGYYLKKVLSKKNRRKIKLLEIGCGNGFFLEKAKSMGVGSVFGIEPGKSSVENASKDIKKRIQIDILRTGQFKKNYFDIICCFHTLDHVVDPNFFLQIVNMYLKKKGKVLFVTHNACGLSVKLFQEKSPIFDIEHIYLFNPSTLSRIFIKNNFKKTTIYNVINTYPLSYWTRLCPMPEVLKDILLSTLHFFKFE